MFMVGDRTCPTGTAGRGDKNSFFFGRGGASFPIRNDPGCFRAPPLAPSK